MTTYRSFSRHTWLKNPTWPNGFEPNAVPMDGRRTLAEHDTRADAIEWCEERNHVWRRHSERVRNKTASPTQINVYYTSPRYEWTEV